jgi:hypothetical protein
LGGCLLWLGLFGWGVLLGVATVWPALAAVYPAGPIPRVFMGALGGSDDETLKRRGLVVCALQLCGFAIFAIRANLGGIAPLKGLDTVAFAMGPYALCWLFFVLMALRPPRT